METWEKELNQFMNEKKLFPYKKWNSTLIEWSKEYTSKMEGLDGIRSKTSVKDGKVEISLSINYEKEFFAYLQYLPEEQTGNPLLNISSTKYYNVAKKIRNILKVNENSNDMDYYEWNHDCIDFSEGLALEKGFVLQYITIQFKKYVQIKK